MNISFITYHYNINGTYMNMLDTYDLLSNTTKSKLTFYVRKQKQLKDNITESHRKYNISNIIKLDDVKFIIDDIVIIDVSTLFKLNLKDIIIACKKLIVLDNLELTYHLNELKDSLFYYDINLHKILESKFRFNDVIFLMPHSNYKTFQIKYPTLPAKIYYKGFSLNRLNDIEIGNNSKLFFREGNDLEHTQIYKLFNNSNLLKTENELFNYSGFIYYRREKYFYYEQLGRLIFEFLILQKKVHYFGDIYFHNDGLTDYLNHYSITPINNELLTDIEKLKKQIQINNINLKDIICSI